MPTIHIPRSARFGGTVPVGVNGTIRRIPVGISVEVTDAELIALTNAGIPTTTPQPGAGQIWIPSSYGSRIAIGVNGVVSYILTGVSFTPTAAQLSALIDKQVPYFSSIPPAGFSFVTDPKFGDAIVTDPLFNNQPVLEYV